MTVVFNFADKMLHMKLIISQVDCKFELLNTRICNQRLDIYSLYFHYGQQIQIQTHTKNNNTYTFLSTCQTQTPLFLFKVNIF